MNTMRPFPPEVWEQTPVAVREYIHTLEARVAVLEATVQRLLERLQQDSHNSSRPPSSDSPPARGKHTRRGPSGRKRGGQPGHPGQTRALVPIAEVDTVVGAALLEHYVCVISPVEDESLSPDVA